MNAVFSFTRIFTFSWNEKLSSELNFLSYNKRNFNQSLFADLTRVSDLPRDKDVQPNTLLQKLWVSRSNRDFSRVREETGEMS